MKKLNPIKASFYVTFAALILLGLAATLLAVFFPPFGIALAGLALTYAVPTAIAWASTIAIPSLIAGVVSGIATKLYQVFSERRMKSSDTLFFDSFVNPDRNFIIFSKLLQSKSNKGDVEFANSRINDQIIANNHAKVTGIMSGMQNIADEFGKTAQVYPQSFTNYEEVYRGNGSLMSYKNDLMRRRDDALRQLNVYVDDFDECVRNMISTTDVKFFQDFHDILKENYRGVEQIKGYEHIAVLYRTINKACDDQVAAITELEKKCFGNLSSSKTIFFEKGPPKGEGRIAIGSQRASEQDTSIDSDFNKRNSQ